MIREEILMKKLVTLLTSILATLLFIIAVSIAVINMTSTKTLNVQTNQVALAEWVMPFCQYSLSSIQYFSQLTTIYLLEAYKKLLGSKNFLYSYSIEMV